VVFGEPLVKRELMLEFVDLVRVDADRRHRMMLASRVAVRHTFA
jgi:hypothetical protein